MAKPLLALHGVSKRFCRQPRRNLRYGLEDIAAEAMGRRPARSLRPGEFWSLQDVSLDVEAGEVLGVIGHNGAGKSTLINLAARVTRPSLGRLEFFTDRVIAMDAHGGLSGSQTGRENIISKLSMHGVPPNEIREAIPELIAYSGLGEFIDAPTGTYSMGMRLRLAFSIYTRLKPDLFLVDEAIGGGDLRFRSKFQRFLRDYVDAGGSILLASHDLFLVQTLCRRCVLLDGGRVLDSGPPDRVVKQYEEMMDGRDAATSSEASRSKSGRKGGPAPTGDVTLLAAEITGEEGGPLLPGEPAVVRLRFTAGSALGGVQWGMEIGGLGQFPLASAVSPPDMPYEPAIGENELTCRIERLPLMPGAYELHSALIDHRSGAPLATRGFESTPDRFTVGAPEDATMNILRHRQGLLYLPVEFEAN
ncbi:MAG: ATP-binding cassette domain-containing protein [Armatimonadetes bacterium]|nr:ATP-binding cassette domain-containing protein [Armatimonadota bacterium]